MKTRIYKKILFSLILSLPVMILYMLHFFPAVHGMQSTGFIQPDMPTYMANARQYADGDHNGIAYSNPYDFHKESPKIYFQPQLYVLGLLLKWDSIDPGYAFAVCGLLCTFLGFIVLQNFLDVYCPSEGWLRVFLLCTAAWGGGCLVLMSLTSSLIGGKPPCFFLYEPFDGWWFFNLGRNFVYPTEAIYHLITLLLFLCVFLQKTRWTLILTWLIALCHPWTGIQYASILFAYTTFEYFFMKSERFTIQTVMLFSTPLLYSMIYTLVFLPSFLSHRLLLDQLSLDWSMKWPTILCAYGPIGIIAAIRFRDKNRFVEWFADPFNRFLAFSVGISFILANHEFLFSPKQPLHFTRGHVWTPLCLLALPVLADVWRSLFRKRKRLLCGFVTICFAIVILSDNMVWFLSNYFKIQQSSHEIRLSDSYLELFEFIKSGHGKPIIVSDDLYFSFLTATYTPARPYVGHWYNTPEIKRKKKAVIDFFVNGKEPEELRNLPCWVVTWHFGTRFSADGSFRKIFSTHDAGVFERLMNGSGCENGNGQRPPASE